MIHKSVFKNEVIELLDIKPKGVYVDLTLGSGGHSLEILKKLDGGKLLSFDVDAQAIREYELRLEQLFKDVKLTEPSSKVKKLSAGKFEQLIINDNFENLDRRLKDLGIEGVDGILADLGWSGDQLERIEGLSFDKRSDRLDMRLGKNLNIKASDLLNALGKRELKIMFERYADFYGEWNNKLVEGITKFRKQKLFETVGDLVNVLEKSIKRASLDVTLKARVFQALRIAVNNELTSLENMLQKSFDNLKVEGRLILITFHSGEEKVLKKFLAEKNVKSKFEYISNKADKQFLQPSVEELLENIRSRSAKLWGIKKIKN